MTPREYGDYFGLGFLWGLLVWCVGLNLVACSSTQSDKAALARDGIRLAQDACIAYERGPKRDAATDRLCFAVELATRTATAPSVSAAAGAQ